MLSYTVFTMLVCILMVCLSIYNIIFEGSYNIMGIFFAILLVLSYGWFRYVYKDYRRKKSGL
jgi:hypothetical protein